MLFRSGQTISQPYIVALMTQALELDSQELKILEIGTGSGFQAAVLAKFCRRIFTIERHKALSDRARILLRDELGYQNIVFKVGDGTRGWQQYAPFDRIVVTAGAPVVPESLVRQLTVGGRMVIPSGGRDGQKLELYIRKDEGTVERSVLCDVSFVPLVGEHGWKS